MTQGELGFIQEPSTSLEMPASAHPQWTQGLVHTAAHCTLSALHHTHSRSLLLLQSRRSTGTSSWLLHRRSGQASHTASSQQLWTWQVQPCADQLPLKHYLRQSFGCSTRARCTVLCHRAYRLPRGMLPAATHQLPCSHGACCLQPHTSSPAATVQASRRRRVAAGQRACSLSTAPPQLFPAQTVSPSNTSSSGCRARSCCEASPSS